STLSVSRPRASPPEAREAPRPRHQVTARLPRRREGRAPLDTVPARPRRGREACGRARAPTRGVRIHGGRSDERPLPRVPLGTASPHGPPGGEDGVRDGAAPTGLVAPGGASLSVLPEPRPRPRAGPTGHRARPHVRDEPGRGRATLQTPPSEPVRADRALSPPLVDRGGAATPADPVVLR